MYNLSFLKFNKQKNHDRNRDLSSNLFSFGGPTQKSSEFISTKYDELLQEIYRF